MGMPATMATTTIDGLASKLSSLEQDIKPPIAVTEQSVPGIVVVVVAVWLVVVAVEIELGCYGCDDCR